MKNLFLLFSTVFFISISTAQTEVGGAILPNSVIFNEQNLMLNGAGVREKFWIDLYAAGLYLEQKSNNANEIVAANEPMAIKLHIVSGLISSNKLIDALRDGFEKSTNGNIAPIEDDINTLIGFLNEEIEEGDVFDLVYVPTKGVVAYKNGEGKGNIQGLDFKKALFGIWLSNRPADDSLKDDLLGE